MIAAPTTGIDVSHIVLAYRERVRDVRAALKIRRTARTHPDKDRRAQAALALKAMRQLILVKRVRGDYGPAVRLRSMNTLIGRLI